MLQGIKEACYVGDTMSLHCIVGCQRVWWVTSSGAISKIWKHYRLTHTRRCSDYLTSGNLTIPTDMIVFYTLWKERLWPPLPLGIHKTDFNRFLKRYKHGIVFEVLLLCSFVNRLKQNCVDGLRTSWASRTCSHDIAEEFQWELDL